MAGAETVGLAGEGFTDVLEIFVEETLAELTHDPDYSPIIHDAYVRITELFPGHSEEAIEKSDVYLSGFLYGILEARKHRTIVAQAS